MRKIVSVFPKAKGDYAMVDSLKFYVYVSDTKVDMLYQQVPKRTLQKIASELSINLKLMTAGLGATIKPSSWEETRYSKLKIVTKYLEEQEDIGAVDNLGYGNYFKGTLPMKWGAPPEDRDRDFVFFAGSTAKTLVGLGGSTQHLIGTTKVPNDNRFYSWPSSLSYILTALEKYSLSPKKFTENEAEAQALWGTEVAIISAHGISQNVEFLAVKYFFGGVQSTRLGITQTWVVLGSPLYVALAK